jgi:hypothetical protein
MDIFAVVDTFDVSARSRRDRCRVPYEMQRCDAVAA